MSNRQHLDLFSGIGGFALAAGWAGFETVAFCEKDPFCREVLAKHWPGVPIHEDVRKLDGRQFRGLELLSGGFPCQPFSQCGLKRGENDDRDLWPEMGRIISEARPRWVIGENVLNFYTLGLDRVLVDLEGLDYSCEAICLPACAIGAPHRRERVWIIAHANSQSEPRRASDEEMAVKLGPLASNPDGKRRRGRPAGGENATNAWQSSRGPGTAKPGRLDEWWQIEPPVGRVAHGVPRRVDRLRALGNSVVPQLAFELLQLMK